MMHPSLDDLPDLWEEVYELVSQVPEGMVTTYGEVAKALGDSIAARFVGLAMSMNTDVARVPCRRVVRSNGGLGGYTSPKGVAEKARLLKNEGITIRNGRVADLERHLFTSFQSSEPLRLLRKRQRALKSQVAAPVSDIEIDRVVGMDVSYGTDRAFASMVVFDARSGSVIAERAVATRAVFPYIPTYLAFRELPLIAPLAALVEDGTVVMYDGNGILHPEKFGIASHAGVAFDLPTIGVAKRLLCGRVDTHASEGASRVTLDGEVLGYAYSRHSRSPVYVSPGNGISQAQALLTVMAFTKHRIPQPIRAAHKLANEARRSAINK
ncbi:MAG: endonuclease V [Methanobacteriota archaeon]|nr:MAG: endonuclease V [Euryarchaeota archaeon]